MSPVQPRVPRLHVVTDDRVLDLGDWAERSREVLESGREELALHVRGPASPGRRLFERTRRACEAAADTGSLVVVNDRVDVALALSVGGVQLGHRSLPFATARRLLEPGVKVGCSLHTVNEMEACEDASWVIAGAMYPTASHPGRAPAGPGLVVDLRARWSGPVLAIGGITPERVPEVIRAGAYGVAALSAVWYASDPAAAVRGFLGALRDAEREAHSQTRAAP